MQAGGVVFGPVFSSVTAFVGSRVFGVKFLPVISGLGLYPEDF